MRKIFLILLAVLLLVTIFQKQLTTHLKIALFISEEFPQISIKPLGLLTKPPTHQKVELPSKNGKIVADLYIPNPSTNAWGKHSAVILAMGVRTQEKDKPLLWHFASTMARLGYVVFWPRLETLDKGQSLPEEPETFIESFKYLEKLSPVDAKRVSYVGFSVGSSTALVASTDPKIRDQVHGLVFFGGYFDIFDYLISLATKSIGVDGKLMSWNPAEDAINHAKGLLETRKADHLVKIFEATSGGQARQMMAQAPADELDGLKKYQPKDHIKDFTAQIFILHDKSDTYVPYVESIKLNQALSQRSNKTFLLVNLFEHVQPNRPLTKQTLGELLKLYGFLYQTLSII